MNNINNKYNIYRNCNINYNMEEICINMINDYINDDENNVGRTG